MLCKSFAMAIIVEGCVFGNSISTFVSNSATVSFDFVKMHRRFRVINQ